MTTQHSTTDTGSTTAAHHTAAHHTAVHQAAKHGLALLAVLVLVACGRQGVSQYEVAKPPAKPKMKPRPMAGTMGGTMGRGATPGSAATKPYYVVPAGWTEKPAGGMRLATFAAGEGPTLVDVSIVSLPGTAGGVPANFNRWRRQAGLAPLPEEEMMRALQPITIGGTAGHLAVLSGGAESKTGKAIVAVLVVRAGKTWFFKMSGQGPGIKTHIKGFRALLRSIRFGPAKAPVAAAPPASGPAKPGYTVPRGWTDKPAGGMRLASLAAGAGAASIDASIVALPGEAGGVSANFNRWRRQAGLPPLPAAAMLKALQPITVDGVQGHFAVIDGDGATKAIAAALVLRQGMTWFFKMAGPSAAVQANLSQFRALLGSVHFDATKAAAPKAAAKPTPGGVK